MKKNILITKMVLWGFLCISMVTNTLIGMDLDQQRSSPIINNNGAKSIKEVPPKNRQPKKNPGAWWAHIKRNKGRYSAALAVGLGTLLEGVREVKNGRGPLNRFYGALKKLPAEKLVGWARHNPKKAIGGGLAVGATLDLLRGDNSWVKKGLKGIGDFGKKIRNRFSKKKGEQQASLLTPEQRMAAANNIVTDFQQGLIKLTQQIYPQLSDMEKDKNYAAKYNACQQFLQSVGLAIKTLQESLAAAEQQK